MGQIPAGEQLFEHLPSPLYAGAKCPRFGRGYLARPHGPRVHHGAAEAAEPFDLTFIVFP
jgi:hypothetical protein